MSNNICETCKWRETDTDRCHRHAPRPCTPEESHRILDDAGDEDEDFGLLTHPNTWWVKVELDDWCGEWQGREVVDLNPFLAADISKLRIAWPGQRWLHEMKIYTVGDLLRLTEDEFLDCGGIGDVTLRRTKQVLAEHSLKLAGVT